MAHISIARVLDQEKETSYNQQLEEMKKRVENRPLLFERASQVNAVRSAEGKYLAALRRAGMNEKQIEELLSKTHKPV